MIYPGLSVRKVRRIFFPAQGAIAERVPARRPGFAEPFENLDVDRLPAQAPRRHPLRRREGGEVV